MSVLKIKNSETGEWESIPFIVNEIPNKLSQFENDTNFVNEEQLSSYALKTEIPTQISELTNNKGYTTLSEVMTLILTNHYTKTEVDDKLELAVPKTATTLSTGSVAKIKTLYYLGEQTLVLFGLPSNANVGDYIFINFRSGENKTTFTMTTNNYVGDVPTPIANKTYEFLTTYNGETWVCQWIAY